MMYVPGINENESVGERAGCKHMELRCPFKMKKKTKQEGKPIACHTMTFPFFMISIYVAEWKGLFLCNRKKKSSLRSHSGESLY